MDDRGLLALAYGIRGLRVEMGEIDPQHEEEYNGEYLELFEELDKEYGVPEDLMESVERIMEEDVSNEFIDETREMAEELYESVNRYPISW